jgi:hypothetical protein
MAVSEHYRRRVTLLVRALPFVAEETCFALKGGTAINFFVRDLPRLSIDIDLTYLPVADRVASLRDISAALKRIGERLSLAFPEGRVHEGLLAKEKAVNKLIVQTRDASVKIEVTPVLRGCVYEPVVQAVSPRVEDQFGYAAIQVVSFADLYAGKIVAALDRQHPRDLFDVRDLLANEGIDDDLRTAFIVYLLSHNRPFAEVLAPTRKDITQEFERGFDGMTETPVTLDELIEAREQLIEEVVGDMPQAHKDLLVSFKTGDLDWSLLAVPDAEHLPAIKWRIKNLAKLDPDNRADLLEKLKAALYPT